MFPEPTMDFLGMITVRTLPDVFVVRIFKPDGSHSTQERWNQLAPICEDVYVLVSHSVRALIMITKSIHATKLCRSHEPLRRQNLSFYGGTCEQSTNRVWHQPKKQNIKHFCSSIRRMAEVGKWFLGLDLVTYIVLSVMNVGGNATAWIRVGRKEVRFTPTSEPLNQVRRSVVGRTHRLLLSRGLEPWLIASRIESFDWYTSTSVSGGSKLGYVGMTV